MQHIHFRTPGVTHNRASVNCNNVLEILSLQQYMAEQATLGFSVEACQQIHKCSGCYIFFFSLQQQWYLEGLCWLVKELLCLMSKQWENGVIQCLLLRQLMGPSITMSYSNGVGRYFGDCPVPQPGLSLLCAEGKCSSDGFQPAHFSSCE